MTTINSRQPDLNATNAVNLNDNSVESLNKALKKSTGKIGARVVVQFGLDKFASLTKKEAQLLTENPKEFAKLQKFNSFKTEIDNKNYCKLTPEKIANIKSRLETIQSKLSEYNQKEEVGQRKFHLAGTLVFDENSNIKEFKSDISKHPPDLAQVKKINKLVEKYTDLPIKNENTSIKSNYLNKQIKVASFTKFFKINSLIRKHSGLFKKKNVDSKPHPTPLQKKVRFSGVEAQGSLPKTISKVITNANSNSKLEIEAKLEENSLKKVPTQEKLPEPVMPDIKPEPQPEKISKENSFHDSSLQQKEEIPLAKTNHESNKEAANWQSKLKETLFTRTPDLMDQVYSDLVKDLAEKKISQMQIIEEFTRVALSDKKNIDKAIYTTLLMIDRAGNKPAFKNVDLKWALCEFIEQKQIWNNCPTNYRDMYFLYSKRLS